MARDIFIHGECLVQVKSRSDSAIGTLTQLGLASDPIRITPNFRHMDINVDAWGGGQGPPVDMQFMLSDVDISMTLVHFDRTVLDECLRLSMAGAPAIGQLPRAGSRIGANVARFAVGNNYIGLNLTSPAAGKPWRFFFAVLTGPPIDMPIGTERSLVQCKWRAIPYTTDPYGGGTGAQGFALWDYSQDT